MSLHDAIEQYVTMVTLGSQALGKMIKSDVEASRTTELSDLISKIEDGTERMERLASPRAKAGGDSQ